MNLEDYLATAAPAAAHGLPDRRIAHAMAVCAGYAYSDADTVGVLMGRVGLEGNRCVQASQLVDAMFISSYASIVQSANNKVVIVGYRGTRPTSAISWLTDLTLDPTRLAIAPPQPRTRTDRSVEVHGGFLRNVRATRREIRDVLRLALQGKAIDGDKASAPMPPPQALYVTGHSLGGAMAVIFSILMHHDDDYAELRELLKGIYTFGQPMIGSPGLADACTTMEHPAVGTLLHRYVNRNDVVPHAPPQQSGEWAHFGQELHYSGREWQERKRPIRPMGALGLLEVPLDGFTRLLPKVFHHRFRYSIYDHGPEYYIQALTEPGEPTEFGDSGLGTPAERR